MKLSGWAADGLLGMEARGRMDGTGVSKMFEPERGGWEVQYE